MDDEEYTYQALQEPLYRVETGNYEYRLVLRCRQDSRERFAKLRSDVLVKLELLDQKHVQDIVFQLQRLVSTLSTFHNDSHALMKDNTLFPIELDLSKTCTFTYADPGVSPYQDDDDDDEEDVELAQAIEAKPTSSSSSSLTESLIDTSFGVNVDLNNAQTSANNNDQDLLDIFK